MKFLFPVAFCGGWFNAICSLVSYLFRHVSFCRVNSLDAVGGTRDRQDQLQRQELLRLRHGQKRGVQQGGEPALLVPMYWYADKVYGVVVITIGLLASPARGQEFDAAWFKANYLPAAEKLDKAYSECSAKVSVTNTNDKSGNVNKMTIQFAFDGTRRKFDRTIEGHDGFRRVIVASPDVSFKVLTRQEQGPLLESVNRSSMGFAQATKRIDEQASDSIYSAFAFLEERVSSWMKHQGFQIKGVKREGDKVRLDFHCKADDLEHDGWVAFLPNRQWAIDGYDIALKRTKPTVDAWRNVVTVTYGGDDPVPVLTGKTDIVYGRDWTDTGKMVVEELTFAKVPASAFQLSAYGYDNRIASPASIGKSLWFWLAIAAVLCLLTAFGIRVRYRHVI